MRGLVSAWDVHRAPESIVQPHHIVLVHFGANISCVCVCTDVPARVRGWWWGEGSYCGSWRTSNV